MNTPLCEILTTLPASICRLSYKDTSCCSENAPYTEIFYNLSYLSSTHTSFTQVGKISLGQTIDTFPGCTAVVTSKVFEIRQQCRPELFIVLLLLYYYLPHASIVLAARKKGYAMRIIKLEWA